MSRIFVNPNTFDRITVYSPRGTHPTLAEAIKTLAGTDQKNLDAVNANLAAVQRALRAQNEEAAALAAGFTRELTADSTASTGKSTKTSSKASASKSSKANS